jgi:DNA-binding NarL/FixJ family response regulator
VRAAARGEAVLSPSVATRLVSQVREPLREPLSQRELEILELVARGTTNGEVASRLYISGATVKTHLLHIYAKLGVNDRAAAVAEAFERPADSGPTLVGTTELGGSTFRRGQRPAPA